jgi:hypothetical protein
MLFAGTRSGVKSPKYAVLCRRLSDKDQPLDRCIIKIESVFHIWPPARPRQR